MEHIKKAYMDLYESARLPQGYRLNKERVPLDQLSHFAGMKGDKYDQQKTRLLIVGRAVNGWSQQNTTSADAFAADAAEQMCNRFRWVIWDDGALRNDYWDHGDYYWLNDSPFWRTGKRIWMCISNHLDFADRPKDRWVDYIAWTNLYKIAPKDTGNPTVTMINRQLDACKKILKAEIAYFQPTHILFVTGYEWWFDRFRDLFDAEFCRFGRNAYRGEKKNNDFAEASGVTAEGIKLVVACRPEFRDENLYVNDVIRAFAE